MWAYPIGWELSHRGEPKPVGVVVDPNYRPCQIAVDRNDRCCNAETDPCGNSIWLRLSRFVIQLRTYVARLRHTHYWILSGYNLGKGFANAVSIPGGEFLPTTIHYSLIPNSPSESESCKRHKHRIARRRSHRLERLSAFLGMHSHYRRHQESRVTYQLASDRSLLSQECKSIARY